VFAHEPEVAFEGLPDGTGNPVGKLKGGTPVGMTPEGNAVGPTLTMLLLLTLTIGKPEVPAAGGLEISVAVVDVTLVLFTLAEIEPVPITDEVVAFTLGAAEPVPAADEIVVFKVAGIEPVPTGFVGLTMVTFGGKPDVPFDAEGGAPPAQNPFQAAV